MTITSKKTRAEIWNTDFPVITYLEEITFTLPLQDKIDRQQVDEKTINKIRHLLRILMNHNYILHVHRVGWGKDEAERFLAGLHLSCMSDILSHKLLSLPHDHWLLSEHGREYFIELRIEVLNLIVNFYFYNNHKYPFHETIFNCCLEALELGSKDHFLYYYAGIGWFRKQEYRKSIEQLEMALVEKPNDLATLMELSLDYYYLDEWKMALTYIKKAEENAERIKELDHVVCLYLVVNEWSLGVSVFDKILSELKKDYADYPQRRLYYRIFRHITIYYAFSYYSDKEDLSIADSYYELYCLDYHDPDFIKILNRVDSIREVLRLGAGTSKAEADLISKSYYDLVKGDASLHGLYRKSIDKYIKKYDELSQQKKQHEQHIKKYLLPRIKLIREDCDGNVDLYKEEFWQTIGEFETQISPTLLKDQEKYFKRKYPDFSPDVIHFIALAELMQELYLSSFSEYTDHSPIIELYCKAIERETKDWLGSWEFMTQGNMGTLAHTIKNNIQLLIEKSKPRDISIANYRHILIRLKEALFTIASDHRNGPIHYDLAPRHIVDAFLGYIKQDKVLYLLSQLGRK